MSEAERWSPSRRRWCVFTVLLATAAASVMQTFLTVALPTAAASIGATPWYGWVPAVYLVTSTVCIPPWAALSDRFGPRYIHVSGMLIWALGTVAVATATSTWHLLAARAVQGIGAAAVVPAGFAAVTAVYPARVGRLVGLIGAAQATVTLAGGPLGGWLGVLLGWRESLILVAAVGMIPVLLGFWTLPFSPHRSPAALSSRGLLRMPVARRAIVHTMLLAAVALGVGTYLPLLLQSRFQLDLGRAAVLATPALVGVAVGSAIGGVCSERRNTTLPAWIIALVGVGCANLPGLPCVVVGSAIAAAGSGVGAPTQLIALKRVLPSSRASRAAGIIQAARNVGGALGVLFFGLPLQNEAYVSVGENARIVFVLLLVVTVLGVITAVVGWRGRNAESARTRRKQRCRCLRQRGE